MRVTLSVLALLAGILGVYLVGTGMFVPGRLTDAGLADAVMLPLATASPIPCLVLTVSVALAFFGLAVAGSTRSKATAVRPVHIFLWGAVFSVITSAGFALLALMLWQQGAHEHHLGLVFSLAAVQACLGLILGGGATIVGDGQRRFATPVFIAALVQTGLLGAVLTYGLTM